MANVIIPGRGVILAKIESSYGTDASPGAADVIYVEDFEATYSQDMRPRAGLQPEAQGLMSVPTGGHVSWAGTIEIQPQTITTAATQSPIGDMFLRAVGFSRHPDASANKSITYALRTAEHESVSIWASEANSDNTDCNRIKIIGARSDFSLSIIPGDIITLAMSNGFGVAQALTGVAATQTDNVIKDKGSALTSVTYSALKPLLGHNATARLIDNSSGTVYGGGSIASPNNDLLVRSCVINGNMAPTEQLGISAAQGIGRVALRPVMHSLEQTSLGTGAGDFNPYVLRANSTSFEVNLKFPQPGTAGNTLQVACFGQIVDIAQGEDGGNKTYDLTLELRYPRSADGTTATGLAPANTITDDSSGDARGIDLTLAAGYPATKLLLQFATA